MPKHWFVTGSASGLGRSISEAVLKSGDSLVATAREPKRLADLLEKYGDRVRTIALDVTDEKGCEIAVEKAVEAFGSLDVVVNNAGYGDIAPFEQMASERFGGHRYELLWRGQRHSRRHTDHAKAKKRLYSANFVGWRPCHPARQYALSRRQMGCWRIQRIACQGGSSFWC
jgi:NAD(P)-dependent dehydrogenase (short-subunit alcohol dehydrogenase family)